MPRRLSLWEAECYLRRMTVLQFNSTLQTEEIRSRMLADLNGRIGGREIARVFNEVYGEENFKPVTAEHGSHGMKFSETTYPNIRLTLHNVRWKMPKEHAEDNTILILSAIRMGVNDVRPSNDISTFYPESLHETSTKRMIQIP